MQKYWDLRGGQLPPWHPPSLDTTTVHLFFELHDFKTSFTWNVCVYYHVPVPGWVNLYNINLSTGCGRCMSMMSIDTQPKSLTAIKPMRKKIKPSLVSRPLVYYHLIRRNRYPKTSTHVGKLKGAMIVNCTLNLQSTVFLLYIVFEWKYVLSMKYIWQQLHVRWFLWENESHNP